MTESPSTPAGWYPDPEHAHTQRYWDGLRWLDRYAPDAAPATPKVDSTFAWCLALLPLVPLVVAWFAPAVYAGGGQFQGWPTWAIVVLSIMLAVLDQQRLKAVGVKVTAALAAVLVPLYLIARTKETRSTAVIPVLWFVTFGFSVLGLLTFAAVYSFAADDVNADLSHQLTQRVAGNVDVTCPTIAGHSGDAFTCSATDQQGNVAVVTVLSRG